MYACLILGVSEYVPVAGEHVVFSYSYWGPGGIYDTLSPCDRAAIHENNDVGQGGHNLR